MRRLLLLGLMLLSASPVCVYALSLGNIELKSGLHQPLDARIPILSATGDEIETLHVGIAPVDEFNRAGVNYAGILTQLKFDIQQSRKGPDYIRITSHDPVNEPFLNFLVEANWAKGRLIREFTALLDPPLYDPSRRVAWEPAKIKSSPVAPATTQPAPASSSGRELVANTPTPAPAAAPAPEAKTKPAAAPVQTEAEAAPASTAAKPTSGAYPTLWSAAAAMRPSNAVSMQQMMVALLRTNPEAFIRGNMNLLKKGYVLKMPEQSEMTATSRAEALAEFRKQDALWREYRERGAQAAPRQPKGETSVASAAEPANTASGEAVKPEAPATTDESKLKLLAGNDASGKNAASSAGDLALTKEALESKNRENEELKSQLKENEDIIDKLKSRISLQDSQLAELQQKLSAGTAPAAATTAPAAETPPATESTQPATESAAAAPAATAPAPGSPEPWRSLENEVQTPSPNASAQAPAATEATPAPPAETTPPSQGTASPSESPPKTAAEAPPAEAPTIETPPATAPPPEQATTTEPNKAAEQPPAAAGSTETTPTPAATEAPPAPAAAPEQPAATPPATENPPAPAATEQPAVPAEQKPAEEQPAPATSSGIVGKINELLGKFLPTSILDSVPGGGLTLLGGLLALLGGVGVLAMRRRATPVADSFPSVADDEPVSSFDSALSGATSTAAAAPSMDDEDLFGVPDESAVDTLDRAEPSLFDRTTAQPATTPLREEPEEDPLAEVNVYLAYERFDEAERLIREAIANHPNEHKYKLRLLEVYYSSNNKRAYEEAARELRDAVGGTGPLWDSALAMWREMSPNRELFAGGGDMATTLGEAGQRQFVDITALGEEAISRTVTSAVVPGGATLGESSLGSTSTQAPNDPASIFDPGSATDQAFDMLDITAAGDVKQSDTDILDLSANPASSIGEDASMVAGASEAVNELLSLTKSGAVIADPGANLMESSLDFDAGFMGDQPGSASSTMSPSDLLDFDLGSDLTAAKPSGNIVDFPARTEAANPAESMTTMIDVAPVAAEPPPSLSMSAGPAATASIGETSMGLESSAAEPGLEFDIGGLDLSLDMGASAETRGPESTGVDMKLDTRGSAEVTMGDIDSLSLDEDTVRLFENDLASTNAQDTAPIFGSDGDLTATGGEFGALDEAFRDSTAVGSDELTLDTDTDNLTLDDITKSLEDTVGTKSKSRYGNFETVDLTMDSKDVLDSEQTAELFENDLRGSSAEETFSATSTLGTAAGDDIDTKLNLAKAYIELGDASGARSILDEVVREGIDAQRDEANRLLRELST